MSEPNYILSMSVFGERPQYVVGAFKQVELWQKLYPNWQIRIYTDNTQQFESLSHVVVKKGLENIHGIFWRFLPIFENNLNVTIVRDSDSRLTFREKYAIDEWLAGPLHFHNIKDHEYHISWPIMGGLFGYKGMLPKDFWDKAVTSYSTNLYTQDQMWLRDIVWPFVKNTHCLHTLNDSTSWFAKSRELLINPFDFCGNGYTENDFPIYPPVFNEQWQGFQSSDYKFNFGSMTV